MTHRTSRIGSGFTVSHFHPLASPPIHGRIPSTRNLQSAPANKVYQCPATSSSSRSSTAPTSTRAATGSWTKREAPPPAPLAKPSIRRYPPLLLPNRSRGNPHPAHRNGTPERRRQAAPAQPEARQRSGQSPHQPSGAQTRHRRRKNHGNGDDRRMVNRQRPAPICRCTATSGNTSARTCH